MGDMADYYYDIAITQMAKEAHYEHLGAKVVEDYKLGVLEWRTKAGAQIPIIQMENSHIENCIKMLSKSNNPLAESWVRVFKIELKKRSYGTRKN